MIATQTERYGTYLDVTALSRETMMSHDCTMDLSRVAVLDACSFSCNGYWYTGVVSKVTPQCRALTIDVSDIASPTGHSYWTFTGDDLKYVWNVVHYRLPTPGPPVTAFTPEEVEAAKTHGADAYCSQAMVCDEEREREDMAEWKRITGPMLEWCTESDQEGYFGEESRRGVEAQRANYLAKRRALPMPLPDEHPSDYAGRCGFFPWREVETDYGKWCARVAAEMRAVERGEPVT